MACERSSNTCYSPCNGSEPGWTLLPLKAVEGRKMGFDHIESGLSWALIGFQSSRPRITLKRGNAIETAKCLNVTANFRDYKAPIPFIIISQA